MKDGLDKLPPSMAVTSLPIPTGKPLNPSRRRKEGEQSYESAERNQPRGEHVQGPGILADKNTPVQKKVSIST
jgi:hypothetical protein